MISLSLSLYLSLKSSGDFVREFHMQLNNSKYVYFESLARKKRARVC